MPLMVDSDCRYHIHRPLFTGWPSFDITDHNVINSYCSLIYTAYSEPQSWNLVQSGACKIFSRTVGIVITSSVLWREYIVTKRPKLKSRSFHWKYHSASTFNLVSLMGKFKGSASWSWDSNSGEVVGFGFCSAVGLFRRRWETELRLQLITSTGFRLEHNSMTLSD